MGSVLSRISSSGATPNQSFKRTRCAVRLNPTLAPRMQQALLTFDANEELVEALSRFGARFIIIGGLAVQFHVPERQANDLDILVECTEKTASAVISALSSNPIISHRFTAADLTKPKIQISTKFYFNADILTPAASFNFEEHWAQAHQGRIGATLVKVASVATLIDLLSQSLEQKHVEDIVLLKQTQG